jgi:hypothetical protein
MLGATAKVKELSGATLVYGLFVSAHLAPQKYSNFWQNKKEMC